MIDPDKILVKVENGSVIVANRCARETAASIITNSITEAINEIETT